MIAGHRARNWYSKMEIKLARSQETESNHHTKSTAVENKGKKEAREGQAKHGGEIMENDMKIHVIWIGLKRRAHSRYC